MAYSEPRLAQDRVETLAAVRLYPLPTARTDIFGVTIPKGTQLLRDCETMEGEAGWVGVQYKQSGQKDTFRGYVPRSTVFLRASQ